MVECRYIRKLKRKVKGNQYRVIVKFNPYGGITKFNGYINNIEELEKILEKISPKLIGK